MKTKLTWFEFRSAHKGTPIKEVSELWKKYKEGEYSFPSEGADTEEEESHEESEDPWERLLRLSREFEGILNKKNKIHVRHTKEELDEMDAKLLELSKLTMPIGSVCTPTDSWKLWLGPTQFCLLINTTRGVAFGINRAWWRTNYQNTIYVDRELLDNKDFILGQVERFKRSGRYIPRAPHVGVECKLPQGVKDIQLRGGQGQ